MPNLYMSPKEMGERAKKLAKKKKDTDEEYRECSICDRLRGKKHFSGRNSQCNSCIAGKVAVCGNPKCRKGSQAVEYFKIYSVPADKYYCTQGCMDKANNLSRRQLDRWKNEATN